MRNISLQFHVCPRHPQMNQNVHVDGLPCALAQASSAALGGTANAYVTKTEHLSFSWPVILLVVVRVCVCVLGEIDWVCPQVCQRVGSYLRAWWTCPSGDMVSSRFGGGGDGAHAEGAKGS